MTAARSHQRVINLQTLSGELSEAALRSSLDQITQRHEVLRIRITKMGREWLQRVDPAGSWPLVTIDQAGRDETARAAELRRVIGEEESRPFRIAEEPPVRAVLIRTAPAEHVLLLVMHHIVIDPWGYLQFEREFAELYQARLAGREPRLPALEIQVPDFAIWQHRQLASGVFDEHLEYWRRLLRDLPPRPEFDAPEEQKTEAVQGYTRGVVLDAALTRALKDAARSAGVTLFMLLLSAYHALLASFSGTDDISVSFPVAGRERPETQHLIGYFINMVVVRTDQSRAATFLDLAGQIRDGTLEAHSHQEVPLRSLDGGIKEGYDPFRVMFNLVNYPDVELDLDGLRAAPLTGVGDDVVISRMVTEMRPDNLDIYLIMHEREGEVSGLWLYSPERTDPRVMAAMTRQWPVLLDLISRDPGISLAELRRVLQQQAPLSE